MKLAIVVPCYNEEAILRKTIETLTDIKEQLVKKRLISPSSFILFVNDGSRDGTRDLLDSSVDMYRTRVIHLSHNVGHQNALLAGLHYVTNKVDGCVSMDADLQDDPTVLEKMIHQYRNGCEIVYGVRSDRSTDSMFKKFTAQLFYKLMIRMGVPLVYNHADFRLLSNKILVELSRYHESNLFLRGIIPLIGSSTGFVYYKRASRQAGESKYPFWKMVKFAWNGVTSFSAYPLKVITALGLTVSLACAVFAGWVVVVMIQGKNIPGWASITLPLYFLGGIQLLAIGVLGEYVSRIFTETKRRPPYHIDKVVGVSHDEATHDVQMILER